MIIGKKIFISGGAGFIGSTLVEKLIEHNSIVVFDNFSRDSLSGTNFADHPNLTKIKADILDAAAVERSMIGSELVIHAAAIAGIEATLKNPVHTMQVNMIGTANVLQGAIAAGNVERFVDFSTSEVFGSYAYKVAEGDQTVAGAVGEARWTYAVSKLAGEHLAHAYFKQFGLPTVTLRPFNVYGPGQTGEGALSIFIRKALRNEDIFIFGDGSQIRAWCYIDDMVEGVLCCLQHDKAIGESFNIGNARAVATVHGLAETIVRVLNSKSKIVYRPALSADVELRIPSVVKSKLLLGYEAMVDLSEGILRTAKWIEKNEENLPALSEIFRAKL